MNQFEKYNKTCKERKVIDMCFIIALFAIVAIAGIITGYLSSL